MNVLFVVDPLVRLDVATDTSVGLMHAVQDSGNQPWITTTSDLEVADSRPRAWAAPVTLEPVVPDTGARWTVPDPWCKVGDHEPVDLTEVAAVFIRTEPPVDGDYLAMTHVLDLVDRDHKTLVNDPLGLRACSEHLLGLQHPDLVPPTVVTARHSTIAAFLDAHRRVVLKPVDGFSGRGAFLLVAGDPNLGAIVETATGRGRTAVMVQPWLDDVHDHGNKRLVILDGEILGAVGRHPVDGDFRIHDPDTPAEITARDLHLVDRLRPTLRAYGLRLVGLDVIGDYLIEVNVTSVGALRKADALLGTTWCDEVVDRVLHTRHW